MTTKALPQGLALKRPTMDDLAAILQLMQTYELQFERQPQSSMEDLLIWTKDPDFNLATDAWLVSSKDGKAIAFALVDHHKHARVFSRVTVHPDYMGQGIGTQLLQLNEERAEQHIGEALPDVRVSILSRIDDQNTAARQLLEKHNYTHARSFWRMKIDVQSTPQAPQWSEGITLTTLAQRPDLARAVYEADDEAFHDHWGHISVTFEDFQRWTTERENHDPSLWFLAMDGDEIAGFAICEDEKALGGWVHGLGVRRRWRRRGIGEALLYHAFGEFYRRGIHEVYLGVDASSLTGATRLYQRAGMHIDHRNDTLEKEIRAGRELSIQTLQP